MTTTAAGGAAPASSAAQPRPPSAPGFLARTLNVAFAVAGTLFVLAGLLTVADHQLRVVPAQQAYDRAPQCSAFARALAEPCWIQVGATVAFAGQQFDGNGAPHWRVQLDRFSQPGLPGFVAEVVQPTKAYYSLRAGDPVAVKLWNGRATAIRAVPDPRLDADPMRDGRQLGNIRLAAHPRADQNLELVGGGSLMAVGAVLLVLVLPTATPSERFIRWFGSPGCSPLWSVQGALVRSVIRDRPLLIAIVILGALQAADILSSIAGARAGLSEANPIIASTVARWGDIGFLLVKIPAVVALFLILGRTPRRLAVGIAWPPMRAWCGW